MIVLLGTLAFLTFFFYISPNILIRISEKREIRHRELTQESKQHTTSNYFQVFENSPMQLLLYAKPKCSTRLLPTYLPLLSPLFRLGRWTRCLLTLSSSDEYTFCFISAKGSNQVNPKYLCYETSMPDERLKTQTISGSGRMRSNLKELSV